MRHRYSPNEKSAALAQLEQNRGDIPITAIQTGVSERTLYKWRKQTWMRQMLQQHTPPPPLQQPPPTFESDNSFFDYLRQQIMDELAHLASSFQDSSFAATPHQRALILTQLLDRLIKLDDHRKPWQPRPKTIIHIVGSEGEESYGRPNSQQPATVADSGSQVDVADDSFPPERDSGL